MLQATLESRLKSEAARLGFTLAGIAPAIAADGFHRFKDWLSKGYAGEMTYLSRCSAQREHPSSILENVQSVVMLGLEYEGHANRSHHSTTTDSVCSEPVGTVLGRVASYAVGPDYHRFVWDRINTLAAWLEAEMPGCRTKAVADTAPLLERDFARRAGLGWFGKNTLLINPMRGSYFFLSAVLTDAKLETDDPFERTHCGTCTACLDACPTQAFPEPYVLDARKCISYLTIELRSEIPEALREPMGDWLYGCDVCQQVCPWNRKSSPGPIAFPHHPHMKCLDAVDLLGLGPNAFRERFKQTSLWRNRRAGLLRNAAIVIGNVGDESALPALQKALDDPEAVVRDAAAWAIERIRQRSVLHSLQDEREVVRIPKIVE